MTDPLYELIKELNVKTNIALYNAEASLEKAQDALREIRRQLGMDSPVHGRQAGINQDDDGFDLPHLDPEDDPATRQAMAAEERKCSHHKPDKEVPF